MDSSGGERSSERTASPRVKYILLLVVLGAAALWLVITLYDSFAEKPNLIIITLDTTRADRLGCYGYQQAATPALDRLAREGVLFENARVQVPITLPSHASIMTATNPVWHGLDSNNQRLPDSNVSTLAEVLRDKGYRTGAVMGSFVLAKTYGLAQGFDYYNDTMPAGKTGSTTPEITAWEGMERSIRWIRENKDKRFFFWWHIFDPHWPYEAPEPYGSRFRSNPYDGEIAYTDAAIGQLLSALDGMDLLDRTFIAVIGDHGDSLGEHAEDSHGFFAYNSTLHVPFFIRGPAIPKEKRVPELVRSIDMAPTLLDLLGCGSDPQHQGRSLSDLIYGGEEKQWPASYFETKELNKVFGWSVIRGIERKGVKYIDLPIPELYFLDRDPDEADNAASREPALVEKMKRILASVVEETAGDFDQKEISGLDSEALERLISIGYISGGSRKVVESDVDPKQRMEFWDKYRRLTRAQGRGDQTAARRLLEEMLVENPDALICHFFLGHQYYMNREYEPAIEHLKAAAMHDAYRLTCFTFLGIMCAELERFDEAKEYCQLALKVDSSSVDVYTNLVQIAEQEGDRESMVRYASRILELAPRHPAAGKFRRIIRDAERR